MHHHHSLLLARLATGLALSFLLSLLPVLTGCVLVAAGAGAGTVAYVRGELNTNVGHDYGKVVDATRRALKDLEFARVSENKDALKAVFVSRTALDKKVEVTVTRQGDKSTQVQIRVGLFGDEQLSVAILDKIKSVL